MLKRVLLAAKNGDDDLTASQSDFRTGGGGGFGLIPKKDFKIPTRPRNDPSTSTSGRKRKVVDYSSMGGGTDDGSDAEIENDAESVNKTRQNSKRKPITFESFKGLGPNGESLIKVRKFAKIENVEKGAIRRQFSIPVMTTKSGEVIRSQLSGVALGARRTDVPPRPLFDPMEEHLIMLFDPTTDDREAEREKERRQKEQEEFEKRIMSEEDLHAEEQLKAHQAVHKSLAEILKIKKKDANEIQPKVPVFIDPRLGKILRPHQVEGVKFLYRCATGLVQENVFGSIMADEMGLGKTLQCIALMWTLLKQSPIPHKATIDKCIIACPASLVRNWANELVKWLGHAAPGTLALDGKMSKDEAVDAIRRWCDAKGRSVTQPVLIVSYETLRNLTTEMGQAEVGLLLCDEGHRLKNLESRTFQTLTSIRVKRRVILSGTPIQNDLLEYYSLLSFANPDLLGDKNQFRKNFENAILKGHDADASDTERNKASEKLTELSTLVSKFIIRRTNDLLTKYLPVKYEHVVFCELSDFQKSLYRHFLSSKRIQRLIRGTESQPLKAIGILKKLCNHPDLLNLPEDLPDSEHFWPQGYVSGGAQYSGRGKQFDSTLSGKTAVLERFLRTMRQTSKDKVVLISNYTQTLDVFEVMCRQNRWKNCRLDGTMMVNKRQKLVDKFNDPDSEEWIFLLSSKAGGCGINLIGANRLVLFDPDWNPAADQQALARVWRDGQKKACFVYRFMATGSIEEKIFQRQSHKQALSNSVVDEGKDGERHFSKNDLRELFLYHDKTVCQTHDTFKCKRCKDGKQLHKSQALLYNDTSTWNHYGTADFDQIHDDLLRGETAHNDVSYVFQYCSV